MSTSQLTQAEFFQQHAVDGQLTDAQMAELLTLPEGDTEYVSEQAAAAPGTATEAQPEKPEDAKTTEGSTEQPQQNAEAEPVILAKDGKHTIPYAKLVEARESEKHWKAQAEQAQAQLTELQAQAQARTDAGQAPTKTDNQVQLAAQAIESGEVDPSLFGTFSESDLAKGIAALVEKRVAEAMSQVDSKVQSAIKPIQEKGELDARAAHFQAIYGAHPDADSILESSEFSEWRAKQPSFVQEAYDAVIQRGSAEQVVELFNTFKSSTAVEKAPQAQGQKPGLIAEAKAKAAKAETPVPNSLSEIPGATAGATDPYEAMLTMNGEQLIDKFAGKSPDQINDMLKKLV